MMSMLLSCIILTWHMVNWIRRVDSLFICGTSHITGTPGLVPLTAGSQERMVAPFVDTSKDSFMEKVCTRLLLVPTY
jgi:hypothetical protein